MTRLKAACAKLNVCFHLNELNISVVSISDNLPICEFEVTKIVDKHEEQGRAKCMYFPVARHSIYVLRRL